jgi:Skp family chaperone for outer membrane proteins
MTPRQRWIRTTALAALAAAIAAAAVAPSIAQNGSASAPGGRTAVVDVMTLMDSYQKAQDLMEKLKQEKTALEQELQTRQAAIEQKRALMEGVKEGSPAFLKLRDEAMMLAAQLEAWGKIQQDRTMRQHHELSKDLYAEIQQGVAEVARQQGYDVVVTMMGAAPESKSTMELAQLIEARKVIYHSDRVDITPAVLDHLNAKYQANR